MFLIRAARVEDGPALLEIHKAAVEALCRAHYRPEQIAAWALPRGLPSFDQMLEATPFFVAEREGRVAGYSQVDTGAGEILAVFVHPRHGRKGVGGKLLAAAEEAARRAGWSRVFLNSSLNAVGFYESQGYRREFACEQRLAGGAVIECVRMSKPL